MQTVRSLEEFAALLRRHTDCSLYVRWSPDIDRDLCTGTSRDELTGIELPGLSVNSLHVESWWDGRPLTAWLARRLYDYRHLQQQRGPATRPWVVTGVETGRGPDNEPLIGECRVLAAVAMHVIEQVQAEVDRLGDGWGSLDRS